ncbi:MAG: type I-B CRISPR-associated protein Cas5, partial [Blastocatellia bacterium]|nr:type I-B CRISPR-associated protein Cas5 [Blastocatellia bacterium]
GYIENRSIGGHVEHIGGQSPILIDVLNEVRLVLYLAHEEKNFLELIKYSLENPVRRLEILHLGRAEDWIVIEEVSEIFELSQFSAQRVDADFRHFFWIPEKIFVSGSESGGVSSFDGFEGLLYNLPTFWTVEGFERTLNRHGKRIFEYMRARLNDGLIAGCSFLYDTEIKLPMFLADFRG